MHHSFKTAGLAALLGLALTACGGSDKAGPETAATADDASDEIAVTAAELEGNPFLEEWNTPFGVQPFDEIYDEHFWPAFKNGVLELRKEIEAIAKNPDAPTFDNTILALEKAGDDIVRVAYTFSALTATDLNDNLRELQTRIWPVWTREADAITLNDTIWQRVQAVYEARDSLDLDEQQARLLELTHRRFVRSGAALSEDVKQQVADINAEISELSTKFAQNLLAETKGFTIELAEAGTAGLAEDFKASIWNEEKGAYVLTLDRSVYETFMTQSENRDLRKRMFDGYRLRATSGEYDNGPLLIRIAELRAKRAELMGYESHAHYQLETRMAKTPQGAEDFLKRVWQPGIEQAMRERADMQAMIGDEFEFAGHDWWYYSEQIRKERFDLDENALKPYFDLEAVRAGAFEMANRLFGLTFEPVDVPVWNDVVFAYEVKDRDGEHLGIFMFDMYARDSKRGGAWMGNYRRASNIEGNEIRPLVYNNLNLTLPPEGEPTLMRFSEVETFFHEFGHGLHGIMTQVDYPTFSGTAGSPRDYTEFPAQILEHWTSQPEMLEIYAKHYETDEVIPTDLVERLLAASNHNQGFLTTEFIAASLLDLRWHMLSSEEAAQITDARAFEKEILESYGLIEEIEPRYRSQYFSHTFSGGYSAGYYAYLWSEILDADGFNAFKEAEDIFDPEVAARLQKWVYEAGGLREADELYRNFRGADPSIEPLLRGRGFSVEQTID